MEYLYRCIKCGDESILHFSLSEDKPEVYQKMHNPRGAVLCEGKKRRVFNIINLNNVNRYGTRSKRDTGRDR